MSVEDATAVIQRIVAAANSNDVRAIDELFASDYVDHDPGRSVPRC